MKLIDGSVAIFGTEIEIKTLIVLMIPVALAGIYLASHSQMFPPISINQLIDSCKNTGELFPEIMSFVSSCSQFYH